jgi:hypothetical protein
MDYFEIDKGRCNRLRSAHKILSHVVDRLVELDDMEPELDFEPLPKRIEIDGVTPHNHYYYDNDLCEGMRW